MSTQSRRKNTSITRKLLEAPYKYQFTQAVRLLERSAVYENEQKQSGIARNPVAGFTPPSSESIRFTGNTTLGFPSAEVSSVQRINKKNSGSQWQIQINAMGLTGAMGVMPFHYTELLLKRIKQKDETLKNFFDLFNHRTISLFFKASEKYRLPLQYERNRLLNNQKTCYDPHTRTLLSLIGMGTEGVNNRLYTKDESLLFYSGLLSQQIRTPTGLKQILRSHFNIPVEIEQFVGQWQELVSDVRTKLPDFTNPSGSNVCLGRSAMLGKNGWFAQGKIRVILGPMNKQQLKHFAPGTHALKALHELTRLYVGLENDYEFIIRINRRDLPKELELSKDNPPIMGWNTRLASKSTQPDETSQAVDIAVPSRRLR